MNTEELARLRHYYYKLDSHEGDMLFLSPGECRDLKRLLQEYLDARRSLTQPGFLIFVNLCTAAVAFGLLTWICAMVALYGSLGLYEMIKPIAIGEVVMCAGLTGLTVYNVRALIRRRHDDHG